MSRMSKADYVEKQYADDTNLSIRLTLHKKYSTNVYEFSSWLFDQYEFFEGCKILELGCGTGRIWENKIESLPIGATLILSDYSKGMLDGVKEQFSKYSNLSFQEIDIQNIPFADNSFDIVLANHMLYHVPDLSKALSEVHRVLKKGGVFYASTNSSKGMPEYLHNALKDFNPDLDAFQSNTYSFSLEGGTDLLKQFFTSVKLLERADSLKITETQDLINWIESTISITQVPKDATTGLYDYFENIRLSEGSINIPKRAGVFISTK